MITSVFFLLVLLSEIIGTISGFGSSFILIPICGYFLDFKSSLALTGIIHIFSTTAQLFMFRKEISWQLFLKIGIPSVIFVILGAKLCDQIDLKYAQLIMGMFFITFSSLFLIKRNLKFEPTTLNAVFGGSVAGFLAGLIGTGGAIRGATLAAFDLPKGAFVGTSAGIDFAVDVSRVMVYLGNNYLDPKYYWYIPILLVLAISGAYIGKKLLTAIPQRIFKTLVLLIIFSVGVIMTFGFLSNNQIIN
jgi:uncharacterized membrane protein YfcA